MIPVMQTRFGNNPDGPGNCFSACVASILECSLADLPDEAEIVTRLKAEHAGKWEMWPNRFKWGKSFERLWTETQEYCRQRGLFMLEIKGPFTGGEEAWCVISADSPRGLLHSTVGRGLRVVHDPHPEGGGIKEEDRSYIFFVAIDPAVYCRLPLLDAKTVNSHFFQDEPEEMFIPLGHYFKDDLDGGRLIKKDGVP